MTHDDLGHFALLGARAELERILKAFPQLGKLTSPSDNGQAPTPRTYTKRRGMTAAQRKAVSARMKVYWAAKRAGKATTGKKVTR